MKTVGEWIRKLQEFPEDWPVQLLGVLNPNTIPVAHREVKGATVVAIGEMCLSFGENPLTEQEYELKSKRFLELTGRGYEYTSIHGDHRLYLQTGSRFASSYGERFDRRIVERMVSEGLVSSAFVDIGRVRRCAGLPE